MNDPRSKISRILREAEADRKAGAMRVGTAIDTVRSESRRLRGCLSDESVAAISAARFKSLMTPRNAWHLTWCSACRNEVVELRWLIRKTGGIESPKPESSKAYDFFSIVIRNWQAFAGSGVISAIVVLLFAAFLLFHSPENSVSPPLIATGSTNRVAPAPVQPGGGEPAPILLASRGATNESERRVAVVVGYGDAVADAKLISDKLAASYSVIRVMTSDGFPETRPTFVNIIRELRQLPNSVDGGHLVIFWGGKGVCVNGQPYLLPQDAAAHPEAGGLTLEQLSKAVSESQLKLQSRTIVVQLGGAASSDEPSDFVQCLLAHHGEWQVGTNVQSWLQPFKNGNPEK